MKSATNGVLSADILEEGILIAFNDGRYAIYSAELLLSIYSRAHEIRPDENDAMPL